MHGIGHFLGGHHDKHHGGHHDKHHGGHHGSHHGGHHGGHHVTYPVQAGSSYSVPNQPVGVNQGYIPPQHYNIPPQAAGYPPQSGGYPASGVSYPTPQGAYLPQGNYPSYGVGAYPAPPVGAPPVGAPPAYSTPSQPVYYPQQQTGAYDAAARFGKGSTFNVPPPPPGVAPNAAQVAAAQGQNVTMYQRSADWVNGPPGGGATFW